MPEYPLQFATRQIRRTFERAIGKSIAKIITELVANSDDSTGGYSSRGQNGDRPTLEDPAPIMVLFERAKSG